MIVSLLIVALQAAAPAPAASPAPAPEKKICRSEVPTGSTLPKRTCHTRSEWAQINAANAASAEATLQGRRGGMPGN